MLPEDYEKKDTPRLRQNLANTHINKSILKRINLHLMCIAL